MTEIGLEMNKVFVLLVKVAILLDAIMLLVNCYWPYLLKTSSQMICWLIYYTVNLHNAGQKPCTQTPAVRNTPYCEQDYLSVQESNSLKMPSISVFCGSFFIISLHVGRDGSSRAEKLLTVTLTRQKMNHESSTVFTSAVASHCCFICTSFIFFIL